MRCVVAIDKLTKEEYKENTSNPKGGNNHEAIINHCGLELDRVVASQSFALKILSLLKDLINEKNENENESFVLSQPHRDRYIALSKNNKIRN